MMERGVYLHIPSTASGITRFDIHTCSVVGTHYRQNIIIGRIFLLGSGAIVNEILLE